MSIKNLSAQLEKEINLQLKVITVHGKAHKELSEKIKQIQSEQAHHIEKMKDIYNTLQPAEAVVRAQHPQMNDLFDSLKAHSVKQIKDKDGNNE